MARLRGGRLQLALCAGRVLAEEKRARDLGTGWRAKFGPN
jgi:hypothetical protein